MPTHDTKSNSQELPFEQLTEELSELVEHAKTMLQTAPESSSAQTSDELATALDSIKIAVDRLQSSATSGGRLAKCAAGRTGNSAVGVAFAAGALPLGICRIPTIGSVGWALAAGLLLGMLLRRR